MDTHDPQHDLLATEMRALHETQKQILGSLRALQGNVGCITLLLIGAALYWWFALR